MRPIQTVFTLYRRAAIRLFRDDGFGLASQMAYNALFSIFPGLLVLVAVSQNLGARDILPDVMERVRRFLPPPTALMIEETAREVIETRSSGVLTFGFLMLLWVASNFMNTVLKALGVAYAAPQTRPTTTWKLIVAGLMRRLLAVALVVVFGIASALSFHLFVFGTTIAQFLETTFGLRDWLSEALAWLQTPVSLLLMVGSASLLYSVVRTRPLPLKDVFPGALTFGVLWLAATAGFRFYIMNVANVGRFYGAVGGIIVLMTWFYVSSLLLFFGGEVNAVWIELRTPRGRHR
ncbi:MAG: YihY/virulence factor BrkB family protein [Candidatus Poribacteria bacterium]|nr:YihY/virulence factor BrkB family protein [Candidatus Poribacteria bacterium]